MSSAFYYIDLQDFRPNGAKVLATRPWGISARNLSKIDDAIDRFQSIIIHVPEDISNITPTFWEEFLENVFTKLGWDGFRDRVEIQNAGQYKIDSDLKEAANRILDKKNTYAY